MSRASIASVFVLALAACSEGRLFMELVLPADKALDPTLECRTVNGKTVCDRDDPRLSRFGLRISRAGKVVRTQDTAIGAGEITVGAVPVDAPFDLQLSARSGTGQVLGLGLVKDLVVSGTRDTKVALKFRKPMAYVAGGSSLRVVDTASSVGRELPELPLSGLVDAAAAPNGVLIAAITRNELVRIQTSDHHAVGCGSQPLASCKRPIKLSTNQPASCVAISPDSRTALICHDTGLTAVLDLSADQPPVTFFQIGNVGRPTRVTFEPDGRHAWVLINGVGRKCAGQKSALIRVIIDQNQARPEQTPPLLLGQPASDIAIDPADGAPVVAFPCNGGAIARIEGRTLGKALSVPPPYDIGATENSLVLISRSSTSAIEAQTIVIDRSDRNRIALPRKDELPALSGGFIIPPVAVRIGNDSSPRGAIFWVSEPTEATIYDFVVAPDGRRALVLMEARYVSQLSFARCSYSTDLVGLSYLLIDLSANTVLLSRFTKLTFSKCSTDCAAFRGQPMNVQAVCIDAFQTVLSSGRLLTNPQFDPQGSALLFGGE